jgi:hypothetical protein
MERTPEPWQVTAAPGPCTTMDSAAGRVELWVLGGQRYRVTAPGDERVVEGYERACEVAHELAEA